MKRAEFVKIIVTEFIFQDSSVGVFSGFDREYSPDGTHEAPKWLWVMGIFDAQGNYFKIEIDTRKSKLKKNVQFILDGKAYYHPITAFYTIGLKINPLNGHSTSCTCKQCQTVSQEQSTLRRVH